jgi:glycosyltransferase involved in cell wall biosynthesis
MNILWIPHTGWHIPQRAHLFCRPLAERHTVHVTDWVSDFASLRDCFSRRYLGNFLYRRYRDGRIHVHGVPRVSPSLFSPALRRLNMTVFARLVDDLIRRYGIDVVVGTFVVPPPRSPRLVFDLFDENVASWRDRRRGYADEIAKVESAYLCQADAVVAASSVLVDKAHGLGARGPVHHIPNGVDLGTFRQPDAAQVRMRLGVSGPLVGSVANHDRYSELEKVLGAARVLSDRNVTFLVAGRGSAVPAAQRQARREGLSNVIFTGYVPPQKAVSVIDALDVGICPYSKTPMDDARSPMRLLMYAAVGLPTVCTDLESVRRLGFPNVILVNDDALSLAEGVERALAMPRVRPADIEAFDVSRLVKQYEAVLAA